MSLIGQMPEELSSIRGHTNAVKSMLEELQDLPLPARVRFQCAA